MKPPLDPVFCRENSLMHRFQVHISHNLGNHFVGKGDPVSGIFFSNLTSAYEDIVSI